MIQLNELPPIIEKNLDQEVTFWSQFGDPIIVTPRLAIEQGARVRCERCGKSLMPLGVVLRDALCYECEDRNQELLDTREDWT